MLRRNAKSDCCWRGGRKKSEKGFPVGKRVGVGIHWEGDLGELPGGDKLVYINP